MDRRRSRVDAQVRHPVAHRGPGDVADRDIRVSRYQGVQSHLIAGPSRCLEFVLAREPFGCVLSEGHPARRRRHVRAAFGRLEGLPGTTPRRHRIQSARAAPALGRLEAEISISRERNEIPSGDGELEQQHDRIGTAEAAATLGLSQRRVQQKIRRGEIPAEIVGRSYVLRRQDIAS